MRHYSNCKSLQKSAKELRQWKLKSQILIQLPAPIKYRIVFPLVIRFVSFSSPVEAKVLKLWSESSESGSIERTLTLTNGPSAANSNKLSSHCCCFALLSVLCCVCDSKAILWSHERLSSRECRLFTNSSGNKKWVRRFKRVLLCKSNNLTTARRLQDAARRWKKLMLRFFDAENEKNCTRCGERVRNKREKLDINQFQQSFFAFKSRNSMCIDEIEKLKKHRI